METFLKDIQKKMIIQKSNHIILKEMGVYTQ